MNKFIFQDDKNLYLGTCKKIINTPDNQHVILINAEICMLCDKLRRHILKKANYIINKYDITFIK